MGEIPGLGRALFAAVLLILGGLLNIFFGVAAIAGSSFFVHPTHYLLGTLDSWGWVSVILGAFQLVGSVSLVRARAFGRYVAIIVGALAAINAMLNIPSYPLLSLAVFGLSIWIVWGVATEWELEQADWAGDFEAQPVESRPSG